MTTKPLFRSLGFPTSARRVMTLALAFVALVPVTTAQAASMTLVTPSSVTLNAGSEYYPRNTLVNSSGLSGTATASNYSLITHADIAIDNAWVTNNSNPDYFMAGTPPVLTFDLGGTHRVSDLVLWGYPSNNNEASAFTAAFSTDGVTFGSPQALTRSRTFKFSEAVSLGQPVEASHVRLTFTDNFYGTAGSAGGDRVGLGEVKVLTVGAEVQNLSLGKSYSYSTLPTFATSAFYRDEPHVQSVGVFDNGDLTDGVTHRTHTDATTPAVNTIVGWDPVSKSTEIVFDLEKLATIDTIRLGTHVWMPFANGAPDDVQISFSTTGVAPGDFSSPLLFALALPPGDGHFDFNLLMEDTYHARYVKLFFNGGSINGGANKWMLDEVTIFGTPVPEPSTLVLAGVGLGLLCAWRRKRKSA